MNIRLSIVDQIVVAFFQNLSAIDIAVGVIVIILCFWFIRSWYWRSDETIELLKEIRDSLKNN